MRRMTRILPALLAPALLFASDGKQTCPMPQVALLSPRAQQQAAYHQASVTAELVTGSRHRAVLPGGGNGPLPVVNFIDSDLFGAMKAAGVQPAALSTDAEFLRRISLDLTGQIPDSATVVAFMNDKTPDKRARKIDELLASDPFVDRWTMWFGDLVHQYLRTKNRSDFWGMAAHFSRTRVQPQKYTDPANPNANLTKYIVSDTTTGSYLLNTTSGNKTPRQPASGGSNVVNPAYMFTGETPRAGEAYRDAYGRMLTADRQFARATVNYLWREMFGIAIVEPPNAFDL